MPQNHIAVSVEGKRVRVALNPSMTIGHIVRDALTLTGYAPREREAVHTRWIARRTDGQSSLNFDTVPLKATIDAGIVVEWRR